MKKLNEIMNTVYDVNITGIKINSKEVEKGNLFVCTDNGTADRHLFINDAINNGASAVIVKKDVKSKNIPIIKVDNPNELLPILCSNFYGNPEKKLYMIGVTGTDGKTSVSTIIQTLLGSDKCGYIGTNGYRCFDFDKSTNNTTPDSDKLYGIFNEFVLAKCKYCAMEVSSEALMHERVNNITYDLAVLTNITSEHLNSHGTLENYVKCKCKLFKQVKKDGISILNKDDEHYEEVKSSCNSKYYTYGMDKDNDLYIKDINILTDKTLFNFVYEGKEYNVESPLLGIFNVYNLSSAILALLKMGYKYEEFGRRINNIYVDGRLMFIKKGQDFNVMVDYAHTTNGVYKLLEFVRSLPVKRIITVIGQAGERDHSKRCKVGKIVSDNSDLAVFTYEDPRSEDPKDIIDMMMKDVTKDNVKVIIDRSEAIKYAIDTALKDDIVLVLGKGNETYEKIKTGKIYFNDVEECIKSIENKLKKN